MTNVPIHRILSVNLTTGSISKQTMGEELYRLYPGGKALAAYLLLKLITPQTGPLSPDNVLILAAGLLTGAPISTATRFTASAHSPLTGAYGESEAGGYWGPELKMAGYEAVVITGRAKSPVYLLIKDERIEIRPAEHLWGRDPEFVQDAIRREAGDERLRVLQIGLGGEKLVRYAAISHEMRHFNGRTGMGAVMGSKNLKAVAVRGSQRYADFARHPQKLISLGKSLASTVKDHPQSWDLQDKGTPGLTAGMNAAGILPTHNFREGSFPGADHLAWDAYQKELLKGRRTCYACTVRCKREVEMDSPRKISKIYGGPEYEAIAGFGSNCGVSDLSAVAKANELCNRYGLDAISTSSSIAFAMECYENGLIGLKETDGLDLRFGNAQAMLQMVEAIANRQGLGDLLAEGSRRASQAIGQGSSQYAMQVKGEELAMHDPRGKVGVGLGYAVSEIGADHLVSYHDTMLSNPDSVSYKGASALGLRQALPARELSSEKAAQYALMENWSSVGKTLGLCYFGPAPRSFIQVEQVQEAVEAAVGWRVSVSDLLQIGERATNLARIFNIREGFSRQDDTLPERLFTPLENGALCGESIDKDEFEHALAALYAIKGWDAATGVPTIDRLHALDIGWAAELLPNPG